MEEQQLEEEQPDEEQPEEEQPEEEEEQPRPPRTKDMADTMDCRNACRFSHESRVVCHQQSSDTSHLGLPKCHCSPAP